MISGSRSLTRALVRIGVLASLAPGLSGTPLRAQGCAQCLDATRATPPQVQAAYRHGIYLLAGTATTFFIAGVLLLRRNP